MDIKTKAWIYGIGAILIVLTINLIVLYILGFPLMATEIIRRYYILIILLIGGFGLQIGLFTYYNSLNAISCSTSVASGGISAISMILCCSHYILNILPFLGAVIGISGLSVLSKYTLQFLLIGVASNIIGIGVIYHQVNKEKKNDNDK
ncbi:hypothetical protein J4225_04840 [Candidatus Pacearchaeota archaeon]|nr:hypothetical protein [Candidatus Pacearchaeota archaeon]